jgi:hypothetical protein
MAVVLHMSDGATYEFRLNGRAQLAALELLLSEAKAPGHHFVSTETGEYVNLAQVVTIRLTKPPG